MVWKVGVGLFTHCKIIMSHFPPLFSPLLLLFLLSSSSFSPLLPLILLSFSPLSLFPGITLNPNIHSFIHSFIPFYSFQFRLMNSLLYDFGKSLAHASPYPPDSQQSKLFFFQNLQKFIEMFPCFKSELLSNIKIDSKTPIANLRMNARAGFKRANLQRKRLVNDK